jgi:hypothetical protein
LAGRCSLRSRFSKLSSASGFSASKPAYFLPGSDHCDPLNADLHGVFDLVFPEANHCPTLSAQPTVHGAITRTITLDLGEPVSLICLMLGFASIAPPATVPKLAVAEDGDTMFDQHKIRTPENRILFPISEARRP